MNLVYWNSLHPKKSNLPTFFWDKHHNFKSEKQKPNPTTIIKLGLLQSFEPKGRGPTYTKSGEIILSTLWQSNVDCILQGLICSIKMMKWDLDNCCFEQTISLQCF